MAGSTLPEPVHTTNAGPCVMVCVVVSTVLAHTSMNCRASAPSPVSTKDGVNVGVGSAVAVAGGLWHAHSATAHQARASCAAEQLLTCMLHLSMWFDRPLAKPTAVRQGTGEPLTRSLDPGHNEEALGVARVCL